MGEGDAVALSVAVALVEAVGLTAAEATGDVVGATVGAGVGKAGAISPRPVAAVELTGTGGADD